MSDALKYGLLVAVAIAAFAVVGLVLYNFVANDWRLEGNPLDLSWLFSEDQESPEGIIVEEEAARSQAHRFRADSIQSVRVDADHLHVRVSHADLSRVLVQYLLNADAADTGRFLARAWRDSAGVIRVIGSPKSSGDFRGEIIITLPVRARLVVRSSGGTVSVQGIEGAVDIQSERGDIRVDGLTGTARILARSGSIAVSASTISGELRADAGSVRASFTDGALVVRAGGDFVASRHFGSVDARCERQIAVELASPDVGATLISRRGDVLLRVLTSGSFKFDARAPLGAVTANLPLDTITSRVTDRRVLRGEMNGGAHRIRLESEVGNIDISPFGGGEFGWLEGAGEDRRTIEGVVRRAVAGLSAPKTQTAQVARTRRTDHRPPWSGSALSREHDPRL